MTPEEWDAYKAKAAQATKGINNMAGVLGDTSQFVHLPQGERMAATYGYPKPDPNAAAAGSVYGGDPMNAGAQQVVLQYLGGGLSPEIQAILGGGGQLNVDGTIRSADGKSQSVSATPKIKEIYDGLVDWYAKSQGLSGNPGGLGGLGGYGG